MKHSLNDEERSRLDQRTAAAEKRTGVQIVLAIIERSDAYAELPWKAFALGASGAGLLILIMNMLWPVTSSLQATLLAVIIMLGAGAGFALLSVFVPDFARLFLSAHRAETETRQYAESLFLNKQLFATRERKAVLLLVSLFEHRIVVLPDAGIAQKINQDAANKIIQHMRKNLKAGQTARALEIGLEKLEETMLRPGSSDELPNVIEEKGA